MKNILKILSVTLIGILLTGCYDRDVIDDKGFHHPLPEVQNLDYTKTGNVVTLTWQIPDNISSDFRRPVEVSVQVVENNIYKQKVAVLNEGTTVNISVNDNREYRFVVKLLGFLTPEAMETGRPDRVFSKGKVIVVD